MRIAILGAGAMGSLLGGRLAAGSHEAWLLDLRRDHIDAVRARGLLIERDGGREVVHPRATTDPAEIGPVELVVIFVKAFQTESALGTIDLLLGPETLVLSLQNGLGNLETIAARVGADRVVAGVTYEGARLAGPGHVVHQVRARSVIGPFGVVAPARLEAILRAFEASGLPCTLEADVVRLVWSKAVINIAINALTAVAGLRFDQILDNPGAWRILERLAGEAVAVTRALGIRLDFDDDPLAFLQAHLRRIGAGKSSMLQDFEGGRTSEIDALNGALVARARELGLQAPCNELMTDLVKAIESRRAAAADRGGA
jgi:2-dehydropantoate 2-reductase